MQNINSKQDSSKNNTYKQNKAPSYKDYFNNKLPFDLKQFSLSKCGFLTGKKCEIGFIKKNISDVFNISPSVDGYLVEGELSEEPISSLSNWDRLYIEVFGCKYVVSHSRRSDKTRILGGNDDLKSCVNLKTVTYKNEKDITPLHTHKIGHDLYLSIEGNDIRLWYKKSSESDLSKINNLMWRIPILYIISHSYIKKIEKFIDDMILSKKNKQNKLYKDFLDFRMKRFRSTPVVTEKSVTSNEIWRFFYEYFNVEKNVEELNLIIGDYQNALNTRRMLRYSVIGTSATLLGAFGLKEFFDFITIDPVGIRAILSLIKSFF